MEQTENNRQVFSLFEVTKSIQKTIAERYKKSYWIKAKMNKLNYYQQSGHCYPELVEKKDGKVVAQIKAYLWKDDFNRINRNFLRILQEPLKDGIKILFEAKISFDPVHGLALGIIDIDPAFTLGDLEKEKQETITRLRTEGIFNSNKLLKLSLLPQRIAIISVESSKGYADFLKVIESNSWNYRFFHLLFPSLLQGDNAVASIRSQLKRIRKVKDHFDVVAIIRGGGGDVGLSCYNNYELAKEIALFPIPVITGIGHATNETVSELISFSNAITPTKLAEYLLQKFHNFSVPIQDAERKLVDKARRLITEEKTRFSSEAKLFRSVTENILSSNRHEVKNLSRSMLQQAQFIFKKEQEYLRTIRLNMSRGTDIFFNNAQEQTKALAISIRKDTRASLNQFKLQVSQLCDQLLTQNAVKFRSSLIELNNIEKNIINMSPANVLKRGYSITLLNGKAIKNIDNVKNGDLIETTVFEGKITSIVHSTKQYINE